MHNENTQKRGKEKENLSVFLWLTKRTILESRLVKYRVSCFIFSPYSKDISGKMNLVQKSFKGDLLVFHSVVAFPHFSIVFSFPFKSFFCFKLFISFRNFFREQCDGRKALGVPDLRHRRRVVAL